MVLQYIEALNQKRIILASQSPRRRELLRQIGFTNIEVIVSSFDEALEKSSFRGGGEYALATAKGKAIDVFEQVGRSKNSNFDLIVASDSVVTLAGERQASSDNSWTETERVLEKADSADHAAQMLRALSGKQHAVCTGFVLLFPSSEAQEGYRIIEHFERTIVQFDVIPDAAIAAYVKKQDAWRGKAGAYGIQDLASVFISSIQGDYYCVMGLPINSFCRALTNAIEDQKLITW